uniref:(northern house mosquito) hypothetical protein n=1 Tax=Culex pipiens TaxID=7175 RepID=A0A8D8C346_CULPI
MLTIIACVVFANFALRCRFSSKIFVTEKYFRLEEDSASWFLVCLSFYIGSPAVAGMYSFSKSRSRRISLPAAARSPCSDSSRSRSRLMSRWQVTFCLKRSSLSHLSRVISCLYPSICCTISGPTTTAPWLVMTVTDP